MPQAGQVHVRRRDDAVPAPERAQQRGLMLRGCRRWWPARRAGRGARWRCAVPGRVVGAVLALRLSPSAATGTLVGLGQRVGPRDGRDAPRIRRRRGLRARARATCRGSCSPANLNTLLGLEGCLSGNVPRGATAAGRPGVAVRAARRARTPCAWSTGRRRSSTRRSTRSRRSCRSQTRARAAQADRAGRAARKLALAQGKSPAEAAAAGRRRRRSSSTRSSRSS